MYRNIGNKIKTLAVVIAILISILSIICGIYICDYSSEEIGILIIHLGPFLAWISSFIMYGFGELINKTASIESAVNKHQENDNSAEPITKVKEFETPSVTANPVDSSKTPLEVNKEGANFYNGIDGKKYYYKAFACFKYAADKGLDKAQYNLGLCYQNGEGCEKDLKMSFDYYMKSAVQGNPMAEYKVGLFYLIGEGVEKNNEKAFQWFKSAAELNCNHAIRKLIDCYNNGIGTEKDLVAAKQWEDKLSQ